MNTLAAYTLDQEQSLDEIILLHAPMVKRIAHHLAGRLPPGIQIDDLIQAGLIALVNVTKTYNPDVGASFATYAGIRIKGAMLDEVRRNEWVPRSVRQKLKQIKETLTTLENRLGREAGDQEVAEAMGLKLDDYHQILQDAQGQRIVDIDELVMHGEGESQALVCETDDPSEILEREQVRERLAGMIANLPEKEKLVLSLYYNEDLNLREIGAILGVSESRACQIHSQAMLRLKSRITSGYHK